MWRQIQTPLGTMSYYEQQTQTTCNIACGLMMIRALTGKQLAETDLIQRVNRNVSPDRTHLAAPGFTLEQVATALVGEPWKLRLHTQSLTGEALKRATTVRPAIAGVENPRFAHAILVVGHHNHSFVVLDPQFGLRGIPFDQFPVYTLMDEGQSLRVGHRVLTSW